MYWFFRIFIIYYKCQETMNILRRNEKGLATTNPFSHLSGNNELKGVYELLLIRRIFILNDNNDQNQYYHKDNQVFHLGSLLTRSLSPLNVINTLSLSPYKLFHTIWYGVNILAWRNNKINLEYKTTWKTNNYIFIRKINCK